VRPNTSPPLGGLSLFASAARGEAGFYYALGGIRYYFGEKKSLILRHREDDPAMGINLQPCI